MFKTCSGLILTTEKVNLSDIHRRMQVIFFYFVMKRLMKLLWIGGQKYFVNRKLTKGILRMNLAVVDQFLWLMRSTNRSWWIYSKWLLNYTTTRTTRHIIEQLHYRKSYSLWVPHTHNTLQPRLFWTWNSNPFYAYHTHQIWHSAIVISSCI